MELYGDCFEEVGEEEDSISSPLPLTDEEAVMHAGDGGFEEVDFEEVDFEEVDASRSALPPPPLFCYATASGVVAVDECSFGGFGCPFEGDHRHHLVSGDDGRIGAGGWSEDFELAPAMGESGYVGDGAFGEMRGGDIDRSEVDESCDSSSAISSHHTTTMKISHCRHRVRIVSSFAGGLRMNDMFSLLRDPFGSEYRWSTLCPSTFIEKVFFPSHALDEMFYIPSGFDVIVPPMPRIDEVEEEREEFVLCEGEIANTFLMDVSVCTKKCATRCEFPGRMYMPSHYVMHFDALIPSNECEDHDVVACGFILNSSTQNVMDDVLAAGRSTTCTMFASRGPRGPAGGPCHVRLSGEMHLKFCKHSDRCHCSFRLFVPLIERKTSRVLMCFVSPVFSVLARRPDKENHATHFMHDVPHIMPRMVHGLEDEVTEEEREMCMDQFVQSLTACGEDSNMLLALFASMTD
jgi:hypothetical protein